LFVGVNDIYLAGLRV